MRALVKNNELDKVYLYRGKKCSANSLRFEIVMKIYRIPYKIIETNRDDGLELNGLIFQDLDLIDIRLRQEFKIPELSSDLELKLTIISRIADNIAITLAKMYRPLHPFPTRQKPNPFVKEHGDILEQDLCAIENLLLEDQQFALGNQPSFADAAIFGQIMIYKPEQYVQNLIKNVYPKIEKLLRNIEQYLYPTGFQISTGE